MENLSDYSVAAEAYAQGVRGLFLPVPSRTAERGVSTPATGSDLADQAEKLAPVSSAFTEVAAGKLSAPDPIVRAETSSQLLAKALTDLKVSSLLLEAARDEEEGVIATAGAERSVAGTGDTEELLQIIVSGTSASTAAAERGVAEPKDIAGARKQLSEIIEDTLAQISERTSKAGQAAVGGLFGIGLGQVGLAAGLLGQNVAQALGPTNLLSRLYRLFVDFASKAYESILALLGPAVTKIAGQQVLKWLGEIQNAKLFGGWLEKLYQTKETETALQSLISQSAAEQQKFVIAIAGIASLSDSCLKQIGLVDKLLKGLRYLGGIPVVVLPYGALIMALVYVGICSFVVLNGADYVDAAHVKWLNRVPGVREIVEVNLGAA
jgi:hypothetical protein